MNATRFSILGALTASLLLMPACDDKKDAAKTEGKADEGKADEGKADEATAPAKEDAAKEDAAKEDAAKEDAAKEDAPNEADSEEGADEGGDGANGAGDAAAAVTVGVKVCDDYIAKYGKCIEDNAPKNMKTQMKEALAKSAERFKAQSEGPEKDSLEQSCTAALEAVKKTSKGWGCKYE